MSNPLSNIYQKNSGLPWQTIEGETIVVDPESQSSYELNEVGSDIWSWLDGKKDLQSVHEKMTAEYDILPEEALRDLQALISELLEEKLIVEVSL